MVKNLSDHKKYVIFSYLTIGSNIVTGFILFPIILKNLGIEALGVFGLLFSLYSVIAIGLGWLSGSVIKNLTKYKYLKQKIFTTSLYINLIYGIFTFLLIVYYGYLFKEEFFYSFIFFGIYSFLSFLQIPFYNYLIADLYQYNVALFRFIQQFLFMVFSILIFFIFNINSLYPVFFVLLISAFLSLVFTLIYFAKKNGTKIFKKLIFDKKVFNKLFFLDGKSYFVNGISTILLLQIDILLIDYLYGSVSAGIYLIIWKIPNTIIMLGWRLSDPFQAIVAKNIKTNFTDIRSQFFALEKKIFITLIVVCVGYILLGGFALEFWLGKENIPNIEYMYIIPAFVILFSVMQRVYLSVNYYTNGLEIITKLQFIEVAFKVFFIVFLFDYFKELAPVAGWLAAFLFTILLYRKNALDVLNGSRIKLKEEDNGRT